MASWPQGRWRGVPQPTRGELRRICRGLRDRYDLSTHLARRLAEQTAEVWVVAGGVSLEAVQTAGQRRHGRGRRANRRLVNATAKRQGLQLKTLDLLLARLEQLAASRKTPTLAEVIRQRKAGA